MAVRNTPCHWGTDWFTADPHAPSLLHDVENSRFAHAGMGLLASLLMPNTDMDDEAYISLGDALRAEPQGRRDADTAGRHAVLVLFAAALIRRTIDLASISMFAENITIRIASCLAYFWTDDDGTIWMPWISDDVIEERPAIGIRWVGDDSTSHLELSTRTADGAISQPYHVEYGDTSTFLKGLGVFMWKTAEQMVGLRMHHRA